MENNLCVQIVGLYLDTQTNKMNGEVIFFIYILIGSLLTYIWWKREYEPIYDEYEGEEEINDSMTVITLLMIWLFWPLKLLKVAFECILFSKDEIFM